MAGSATRLLDLTPMTPPKSPYYLHSIGATRPRTGKLSRSGQHGRHELQHMSSSIVSKKLYLNSSVAHPPKFGCRSVEEQANVGLRGPGAIARQLNLEVIQRIRVKETGRNAHGSAGASRRKGSKNLK